VNFWYPTVSKTTLQFLFEKAQNGFVDNTSEDCAALLVLALGAASELLTLIYSNDEHSDFESRRHQSELMAMASVCFDEAMKLVSIAYMEVSTIATQCVFLAAYVTLALAKPPTLNWRQSVLFFSSAAFADLGSSQYRSSKVSISDRLWYRHRKF
jgi:hypothetical protein